MTDGRTIGPLAPTFQKFGGINGTLGVTGSWIVGALALAVLIDIIYRKRTGAA